jgi:hypothetical protein
MPISIYGLTFPDGTSELEILRQSYLHTPKWENKARIFKAIVNSFWGESNKVKTFIWNPWAERMNECIHENETAEDGSERQRRYIGFSGCGSSGKTDFGAIYALVNWWADPSGTLVLCTSTDIKASRLRIWGAIKDYWDAKGAASWPGKMIDSQAMITATDETGDKLSARNGISLLAGEKKKERENIGKIIGAKNDRIIFVADELPELSEAIMEACRWNLTKNPFFQLLALGNFKNRYDPFGQFIEPKTGWDSITVEDDEWETKMGICLHFDGFRSPNVLVGKDIWPGIYGKKHLAEDRKDRGENSAGFWRMCRSFESSIGTDDAIYSESDLLAGKAYEKCIWLTKPIRCSFLDPSFTNGGDRAVQWFGSLGLTREGVMALCYDNYVLLREDVRQKDVTRDFQLARQFRDNCVQDNVSPKHSGLDSTGAGSPFLSIVREEWSHEVLGVDFSGAPSDMQVSVDASRTAKQAYDRKVSELWYVGKEFLKYGQLKGITQDFAREMKARRYETVKGVEGLKVRVETKTDMKERLLFSPDIADSGFGLLHLCRSRLSFVPGGKGRGISGARQRFNELARETDKVYHNLYASQD